MNPPPPSISDPRAVIQFWLNQQCLRQIDLSKRSVRVILLKFKHRLDDLRKLMESVYRKNDETRCSMIEIKDTSKRVEVTVDGKRSSIFAPELMYKIFRNLAATKKRMVKLCESDDGDGDEICINPYHYQLVDKDEENVPDEISDSERNARDMVLHFPVIDVNELPDTEDVEDVEVVEEEKEEEVDETGFFSGAARAMSSTVVKKDCEDCIELRKELEKLKVVLNEKEDVINEKDQRIAELEKALKERDQSEIKRQQPPRNAKKK